MVLNIELILLVINIQISKLKFSITTEKKLHIMTSFLMKQFTFLKF